MAKTPIKQEKSPIILKKVYFFFKKNTRNKIINIGEDEYIIPILVTVVVCPAKNGKAPQTPQPIEPNKKYFFIFLLYKFKIFF